MKKTKKRAAPSVLKRPARFDEWLQTYFVPYDGVSSPWERFPPACEEPIPSMQTSDDENVELFTYTMMTSGSELLQYTDHQVGNGLKLIFEDTFSEVSRRILQGSSSDALKVAALKSINELYVQCLSKRVKPHLGHLSEIGECAPLDHICYMLWDTSPVGYWSFYERRAEMSRAALDVMETALDSDNEAVVESALHGLGHAVFSKIEPSASIIERFIQRRRGQVRDELVAYARAARTGMIQ